jgi:hypothetical protein
MMKKVNLRGLFLTALISILIGKPIAALASHISRGWDLGLMNSGKGSLRPGKVRSEASNEVMG